MDDLSFFQFFLFPGQMRIEQRDLHFSGEKLAGVGTLCSFSPMGKALGYDKDEDNTKFLSLVNLPS